MKHYIGIDPGHSGFAICYELNGELQFTTGKEKPRVIGCPELYKNLASLLFNIRYEHKVICIEEPFGQYINTIRCTWSDIGYLQAKLDYYAPFVIYYTCSQSEWKTYLKEQGLPIKSGMKGSIYEVNLNNHFGIIRTEHEWAAWGIREYALHSGVE